jgi:hypothetical protein
MDLQTHSLKSNAFMLNSARIDQFMKNVGETHIYDGILTSAVFSVQKNILQVGQFFLAE